MPRRPIEPMTLGNMRELGAGCPCRKRHLLIFFNWQPSRMSGR
jgi:hypothetical protein